MSQDRPSDLSILKRSGGAEERPCKVANCPIEIKVEIGEVRDGEKFPCDITVTPYTAQFAAHSPKGQKIQWNLTSTHGRFRFNKKDGDSALQIINNDERLHFQRPYRTSDTTFETINIHRQPNITRDYDFLLEYVSPKGKELECTLHDPVIYNL